MIRNATLSLAVLCIFSSSISAGAEIDRQKVLGNWEAVTVTKDGVTSSVAKMPEAVPREYKHYTDRMQIAVQPDKLRVVNRDEVSITHDTTFSYHWDQDTIVPETTEMDPATVISVNEQEMTLSTPSHPDQVVNLKRVPESEMAFNTSQPIAEQLSLHIKNGGEDVNRIYSGVFRQPWKDSVRFESACVFNKEKPLNLFVGFMMERRRDKDVSVTSTDPHLGFSTRATFDWSRDREEIGADVIGPRTLAGVTAPSELTGTVDVNGTEYRLTEGGSCHLQLKRDGRFLNYSGTCQPITLSTTKAEVITKDAVLSFEGNCVMSFVKDPQ